MKTYCNFLLICLLSLTSLSFSAQTQEEKTAIKQLITDILATPEFSTYREKPNLRYVGQQSSGKTTPTETSDFNLDFLNFNFFSIASLATFFEWLLWIVIVMMIGLFIFYGRYWLGKWRPNKITQPKFTDTAEWKTRLVGETMVLPDNIAQHAWRWWQSGKQEEAISLLYRGALAVLSSRDKLAVQASATEGECLRLVKRNYHTELINYFSKLTKAWQKIAYSQRLPTDKEVQQLCEHWDDHFGTNQDVSI